MFENHILQPGETFTEYCTAGKYHADKKPMIHKRRKIDSFVLFYGISETLYVTEEGKEYELEPDNYLIFLANREHYGTKESPVGTSYYWCHFYIHGDYSVVTSESGAEFLCFGKNQKFKIPTYGKVSDYEKIHLLFHQLISSSRSPSPFSKNICANFLEIILSELASYDLKTDKGTTTSQEVTVANIIEWIRLNASEIKRVNDVASYFGYNSEYLTTLVKKVTNKSLVDHITEGRIRIAKELLRSTSLEISDVAYRCGFSDDKYFFRVFKRLCGMSPGVYRRNYSNAKTNR